MRAQKTTKKTGAETPSLIKESTLPEFAFVGYCNSDDANKYTSRAKTIDIQFVRAARDEGLLYPFIRQRGPYASRMGASKTRLSITIARFNFS